MSDTSRALMLRNIARGVAIDGALESPSVFPAHNIALMMLDLVKGTEWEATLKDADIRRDALPWLVFADWCAENRSQWEAAARHSATRFTLANDRNTKGEE